MATGAEGILAPRADFSGHLRDKNAEFMNSRAVKNEAYNPTEFEHIANVVTHALWVVPSFFGMMLLLNRSNNRSQYVTGFVYGLALVLLFLISATFHSVFYMGRFRSLKETLHLCDRAVIYIFIAASYTPWLVLKEAEANFWTENVNWIVWMMAAFGIMYQYYFHEKYKTLETVFYCIIGLSPAIAMCYVHETSGIRELVIGGAIYIAGVIFFKSDGIVPCAHAIWHVFVNVGASFHFYAVYKYLIDIEAEDTLKSS